MLFLSVQLFFYNLFLSIYLFVLRFASFFNEKAKRWVHGRKDILQVIKITLPHYDNRIWMHCSSLGEFEQGRPLIEKIKKQYPQYHFILTFFSPSGFEAVKNYEHADFVFYLPMDNRKTAKQFLRLVRPMMAIFVKYEFWYYYLSRLNRRKIPTILISAAFRPSQPFFKWYGGLFRKMLSFFDHIFVQDQESKKLLADIGINKVMVGGDTRYDRVSEIASAAKSFSFIEKFKGDSPLLVAGSTWPDDEKIVASVFQTLPTNWKMIIAPHEIHGNHISEVLDLFGKQAVLYSSLSENRPMRERVLVIDNIGMLSSIYRYGEIAFVGGGFLKGGIHNVLEPAVFGLPVFFGPVYEKFVEAKFMVENGFAFPVKNSEELKNGIQPFLSDQGKLQSLQSEIRSAITGQTGATDKIFSLIEEKKYLKR
jgi:3-deoxy-D-manno-octulosonic-acid transferase